MNRSHPEQLLCKHAYSNVMQMKAFGLARKDFIIAHIANENPGGTLQQKKIRGAIRKSIGVMPGVPDYFVLWEGGIGFIEAKTKKGLYGAKTDGVLSAEQKNFKEFCRVYSIKWDLFRTPQELINILTNWGLF